MLTHFESALLDQTAMSNISDVVTAWMLTYRRQNRAAQTNRGKKIDISTTATCNYNMAEKNPIKYA